MSKTIITPELRQITDLRIRIIGKRKMLGISQERMAAILGIARNTYTDIERHLERARLEQILVIVHELDLEQDMSDIVQRK